MSASTAASRPTIDSAGAGWRDWRWQQRNSVRTARELHDTFPGLAPDVLRVIDENARSRRMQLTPYVLGLVRLRPDGRAPRDDDPIWRQLAPLAPVRAGEEYGYDGQTENWEMPEEMVTPIAQHKYPNRIIVRLANICHGYCQFCYEAIRTLERDSPKKQFEQALWDDTLDYVRARPEIEEVILSGGEPLMNGDEQLDRVVGDLRAIERGVAIRIHTRALTFNPFRVTDDLIASFRRHRVAAVGLHVCHTSEVTDDFEQAARRLQTAVPILFANIPLLAGINDDVDVMHRLCMRLYEVGVIPHYLYHYMPHSPGSSEFRTTVQKGLDIVGRLKRRVTNLAVPEFVLPHATGKHTLPLLAPGQEPPSSWTDDAGNRFVRFTNWKGQVVDYFDGRAETLV